MYIVCSGFGYATPHCGPIAFWQNYWPPTDVMKRLEDDSPAIDGHFFGHGLGRFFGHGLLLLRFSTELNESSNKSSKKLTAGWGTVPSQPKWDFPPHAILNSLPDVTPDCGCILQRNDGLLAYGPMLLPSPSLPARLTAFSRDRAFPYQVVRINEWLVSVHRGSCPTCRSACHAWRENERRLHGGAGARTLGKPFFFTPRGHSRSRRSAISAPGYKMEDTEWTNHKHNKEKTTKKG